jgi:hypothetical protein
MNIKHVLVVCVLTFATTMTQNLHAQGKTLPTPEMRAKFAQQINRLSEAKSYINKEPSKALDLFQQMKKENINIGHNEFYIPLLQERLGDKLAACKSWSDFFFSPILGSSEHEPYVLSHYALLAIDINNLRDAQSATQESINRINSDEYVRHLLCPMDFGNIRLEKQSMTAINSLIQGVAYSNNRKSLILLVLKGDVKDKMSIEEQDRYDGQITKKHLQKALDAAQGEVKWQANLYMAKFLEENKSFRDPKESMKYYKIAFKNSRLPTVREVAQARMKQLE